MTDRPSLPVPMAGVASVLEHPAARVVDLRSPSEFAEDHLPGAVNVPLFDDAGRALVGMLYSQVSPERAFEEGERLTVGRIRSLVEEVALVAGWSEEHGEEGPTLEERVEEVCRRGIHGLEQSLGSTPAQLGERPVVLHCWRGGLRSRSVIHFLRSLGHREVVGLEGGYKAYRTEVRARLDRLELSPMVVLRGLTGVGKTLVLRELEALRPGATLDLELLAGHRSSLLGMVGLEPCSQKAFDSRIAAQLGGESSRGRLVVEGESRKVGDVICPPRIWEALDGGIDVELVATRERRIQVLMDDYLAVPEALPLLREQLLAVAERMGAKGEGLVELFDAEDWHELVGRLLDDYYDPLYRHSEQRRDYVVTVDATEPRAAAEEVLRWMDSRRDTPEGRGPAL